MKQTELKVKIWLIKDPIHETLEGITLTARQEYRNTEEIKKILNAVINQTNEITIKPDFRNRDLAISKLKQIGFI